MLIIAGDAIILLFRSNKTSVVEPFDIGSVQTFYLATSAPSAGAFEVNSEIEKQIGGSHLIFECQSIGLLMRYVLERQCSFDLDFTDSPPDVKFDGIQEQFHFSVF